MVQWYKYQILQCQKTIELIIKITEMKLRKIKKAERINNKYIQHES